MPSLCVRATQRCVLSTADLTRLLHKSALMHKVHTTPQLVVSGQNSCHNSIDNVTLMKRGCGSRSFGTFVRSSSGTFFSHCHCGRIHRQTNSLTTFKQSNDCRPLASNASLYSAHHSIRLYSSESDENSPQNKTNVLDLEDQDTQSSAEEDLKSDPRLNELLAKIKTDFGHSTQQSGHDSGDQEDYSFYEVAEDVEEYEYLPQGNVASHQVRPEKIPAISLQRGTKGVFELEELLTLLEDLGAENVVTVPIPPEANFCEQMVIASAKSQRHLRAITEEMLWIHKRKKSSEDPHLKIEGNDRANWSAMDLGNLVLHVFLGNTREYYDLETLWTLGPDEDPKCRDQGDDAYTLSSEDLFWLEANNPQSSSDEGKVMTDQGEQGETTLQFDAEKAGWNDKPGDDSTASTSKK